MLGGRKIETPYMTEDSPEWDKWVAHASKALIEDAKQSGIKHSTYVDPHWLDADCVHELTGDVEYIIDAWHMASKNGC